MNPSTPSVPAEQGPSSSAQFIQNFPYLLNPTLPCPPVEQSTLVYTLKPDCTEVTWHEFSLIVRSLHSYKVIERKEDPESGTISVTVGYFANTTNARKRLGTTGNFISVSRLSSSIEVSELQTLHNLRSKFDFGGSLDEEESNPSGKGRKPPKRPKYAASN